MVTFLKNDDIGRAAQSATALLSVVNHVPPEDMELGDKIQVFCARAYVCVCLCVCERERDRDK